MSQMLKQSLTDERKLDLADQMAMAQGECERLEEHKKNWMKATTEAIKIQAGRVSLISQTIRQDFEILERD